MAEGDKKPVNSLLNVFVPDDLMTFSITALPQDDPPPITEQNHLVTEVTSEIDLLSTTDDVAMSQENHPKNSLPESGDNPSQSQPNYDFSNLNVKNGDSSNGTFNLINSTKQGGGTSNLISGSGQTLGTGTNDILSVTSSTTLFTPVTSDHAVPLFPTTSGTTHEIRQDNLLFNSQTDSGLIMNPKSQPQSSWSHPPSTTFEINNTTIPEPPRGNGNNFRLGGQKPTYAQYSGISGTETPAPFVPSQILPPGMPPSQEQLFDNAHMPGLPTMMDGVQSAQFEPSSYAANYVSCQPVTYHWFMKKENESWRPFTISDSAAIEEVFVSDPKGIVKLNLYDVHLEERTMKTVYWDETEITQIQRCSWFYKGPSDSVYLPYSEALAQKLEDEYLTALRTNVWHKRLEFDGGEAVVFQSAHVIHHFCFQASADEWGSVPEERLRPRVVKRGVEGLQIPPGDPTEVEHLIFLVHGIGSVCDFKFRSVVETVDDFRVNSAQLLQSHFKDIKGRVEFLPVQWHNALHGDGGIDEKLKPITLRSIPKLRHFTNDTLLDILFYTSPVYCQTIMDTVCSEMNRLYALFLDRNPTFNCLSVAVGGHSLGSMILFDLLAHQPEIVSSLNVHPTESSNAKLNSAQNEQLLSQNDDGLKSRVVSYTIGETGKGTGQPFINYPVLDFNPTAFFALGSPIAMFLAVRGVDPLGPNFHLPTCPAFFNIFHPFDPVAYRMEPLINPNLDLRPVLIPHHKGRKRFHLELKDTMTRVGTDFKNKVIDSLRATWNTVSLLTNLTGMNQEIDKAIGSELNNQEEGSTSSEEMHIKMGSLNGGRRCDYVLQEAPHQILNEYLFAVTSHVCYWESEDTVLLVLNELLNESRTCPGTPEPISNPSPIMFPSNSNTQSEVPMIPSPTYSSISEPPLSTLPMPQTNLLSDPLTPPLVKSPVVSGPGRTLTKRPMVDPTTLAQTIGMDPTAPSNPSLCPPPPPKAGFMSRKN